MTIQGKMDYKELAGWGNKYLMCTQIRIDIFFSVEVVY